MSKLERMKNDSGVVKKAINSDTEIDGFFDTFSSAQEYKTTFQYASYGILDQQEVNELIECERKLLGEGEKMSDAFISAGSVLSEARERFKKYGNESFMEWYSNLKLSSDQVSMMTKRYELYLQYPDNKLLIGNLSENAIKEVTNKKTPEELKDAVMKGEIVSGTAIKEKRNEYISRDSRNEVVISPMAQSDVLEIFELLVEKYESLNSKEQMKIGSQLKKIKNTLKKNIG